MRRSGLGNLINKQLIQRSRRMQTVETETGPAMTFLGRPQGHTSNDSQLRLWSGCWRRRIVKVQLGGPLVPAGKLVKVSLESWNPGPGSSRDGGGATLNYFFHALFALRI